MNVIGVVQIPDPKGNVRHVTGNMDGLIVMSIEGALLKLTHEPAERTAALGSQIEIPVRVSRNARIARGSADRSGQRRRLGRLVLG